MDRFSVIGPALGTTFIGAHAAAHHVGTRARRGARALGARAAGRPQVTATDLNVSVIRAAAERLGMTAEPLPGGVLKLTHGERVSYTARWSDFAFELLVPAFLSGDKWLTASILREHGLPVPASQSFALRDHDRALACFHALEKPVVVKPTRGTSGGAGVTMDVATARAFRSAFARARAWSDEVLVEAQLPGENVRVTILEQQVLGAVLRLPAHVVGDGERTVRALVAAKNSLWRSGSTENRLLKPIQVDADVERVLRHQGLGLDSVPAEGATVYLRRVSNADQGGEVRDARALLHPDHLRLALDAAAAVGTVLSGVDLIVADLASPGGAHVNEVNATPALYVADEMVGGRPSTAATEQILRRVFAVDAS